jgi:AcrR family transcriptional regulator
MTRRSDRFPAVVASAADVFIAHGYQRAQVQDVADRLNVAKGTLYLYAEGKAALFAAAVRYADGHQPFPSAAELPVPAPGVGEVAGLVADRLAAEVGGLKLVAALADPLPIAAGSSGDAELAAIVLDLYERLAKHRVAIKLVDRCAPELPDLAAVWFGSGRDAQVGALEAYLTRRYQAGTVTLPGPAPLVARTVIELCALWAVHCHFDPARVSAGGDAASSIDDATVAAMLAEMVVRATARTPR